MKTEHNGPTGLTAASIAFVGLPVAVGLLALGISDIFEGRVGSGLSLVMGVFLGYYYLAMEIRREP